MFIRAHSLHPTNFVRSYFRTCYLGYLYFTRVKVCKKKGVFERRLAIRMMIQNLDIETLKISPDGCSSQQRRKSPINEFRRLSGDRFPQMFRLRTNFSSPYLLPLMTCPRFIQIFYYRRVSRYLKSDTYLITSLLAVRIVGACFFEKNKHQFWLKPQDSPATTAASISLCSSR